jgi:hypothetical protein
MSNRTIPESATRQDWPRLVAQSANNSQKRLAALESAYLGVLAAAPASPVEGQTYYDSVLHKMRTWDGTAWQNHW